MKRARFVEGNGVGEEFGGSFTCFVIVCIIACVVLFGTATSYANVQARGTITSISHDDVVDSSDKWYRVYDVVLDNGTTYVLKMSMSSGFSNEKEVGDYVIIIKQGGGWWNPGDYMLTESELATAERDVAAWNSNFTTAGWIVVFVPLMVLAARFAFWLHESYEFVDVPKRKVVKSADARAWKERKYDG
jgi:hypothetical protein